MLPRSRRRLARRRDALPARVINAPWRRECLHKRRRALPRAHERLPRAGAVLRSPDERLASSGVNARAPDRRLRCRRTSLHKPRNALMLRSRRPHHQQRRPLARPRAEVSRDGNRCARRGAFRDEKRSIETRGADPRLSEREGRPVENGARSLVTEVSPPDAEGVGLERGGSPSDKETPRADKETGFVETGSCTAVQAPARLRRRFVFPETHRRRAERVATRACSLVHDGRDSARVSHPHARP